MVVGHERARVPGDVEPGVIVELQAPQVLKGQIGGPQHRLGDSLQHEGPQLLHAWFGPAEQVEPALEHLLLGNMAGHRVAVLGGLAGQKQRLQLRVERLAGVQLQLGQRRRRTGSAG